MNVRRERHHYDPLMPSAGKADVHMHTTASDGAMTPQQLLEHVEHRTDLDVIAITDHDTIEGALEAKRLHEEGDYSFDLIVGQEVTSSDGHILALFIEKPVPKERSAEETVRRIHQQNGLAVAAHPLLVMRYIDPDMLTANGVGADVLMDTPFDGVEIVNGGPTMKDENARARLLNRTVLLRAETGGSDAHILDAVGKGYTLFPGRRATDFRRAIRQRTAEAVSSRYRVRELLRYLRFFLKMKIRETGRRLFSTVRRKERGSRGARHAAKRREAR
ncbi:MAG: CehA/McbA family metallohydrolase [Patescibacteria group bacterium]